MRIILAVDGSACSDVAVREVARRPWPTGTEVRLIIVDPPLEASVHQGGTVFDEFVQLQRVEANRRLKTATAILKQNAPHLAVTPLLLEGSPKEVILDEAERWGADLIVLGSNGYGAIKRLFLGSVSLAVATNASCSVEIVRSAPDAVSTPQ